MRAVYIGDEVSAAGFRLAGLDAEVPSDGEEAQCVARALADASLVLLSTAVAARLPEAMLRAARTALEPLLLLVPTPGGDVAAPDIVQRLRVQLGLEA